ncbi:MAG: hypothetical protein CTY28_10295 [Hyphomicrobium sp.]|nr:MAG: hypothetical protein CTY28_10295 [Hyphomicrobium sp.]
MSNGTELIIDYFMPLTFEKGLVVCIPATITLTIEPDHRGSRDWAITGIALEGHLMTGQRIEKGKPVDHDIPKKDPMWKAIRDYAERTHQTQIQDKFNTWIDEKSERIADRRRA